MGDTERRTGTDKRSGVARRRGVDTHSDDERRLVGERRSGTDRPHRFGSVLHADSGGAWLKDLTKSWAER